jgi:hypothetical protein
MPNWPRLNRPWAWSLAAGLCAWGLAVFVAAPSLHYFEPEKIFTLRSGDYLHQCANPLTRALGTPLMAYRIFVPTVAWLIGARLWLALALPYFGSIGMLAVIAYVLSKRFDRKTGLIAAMLVATSYAVTWPDCMLGYPDSVAHLMAALLLLQRRPWLVGLVVAAGLLTDERFALELPLVALWQLGAGSPMGGRDWIRNAWRPAALALGAWLLFRHALTVGWIGPGIAPLKTYDDMPATLEALHPFGMSWGLWWSNILGAFRWAWLIVFAAMALRWRAGRRVEALSLAAILVVSAASTVVVFDVARSLGFSFLAIPLALAWLVEDSPLLALRLGKWIAWLDYLTPSLWFVPGFIIWWRPLVLRVFALVTGHDPLDWQQFVL